jgi:hypothetical protein
MSRILSGTRYLVVIPVTGLAIAASVFCFWRHRINQIAD